MRSVHEQARHKHTHTQRNSAKEEEGGKREVKGLRTREKVHPRRHHSVCIDGCTPRQLCNRFHHQRVARRWCMYLPAKKYFYIMRTSILSLNMKLTNSARHCVRLLLLLLLLLLLIHHPHTGCVQCSLAFLQARLGQLGWGKSTYLFLFSPPLSPLLSLSLSLSPVEVMHTSFFWLTKPPYTVTFFV